MIIYHILIIKLKHFFVRYFQQSEMKEIQESLTEIWSMQANLEEVLSLLLPKINKINPSMNDLMTKFQKIALDLKNQMTQCIQKIETEREKIYIYSKKTYLKHEYINEDNNMMREKNMKIQSRNVDDPQNQTLFESFDEEDNQFYPSNVDFNQISLDLLGVNGPTQPNTLAVLFEKSCPAKYVFIKKKYFIIRISFQFGLSFL